MDKVKQNIVYATFTRRMFAFFYDAILCIAICMLVTAIYQQAILRLVYKKSVLENFLSTGQLDQDPILSMILYASLFFFFAFFWCRVGQTLGMLAWKIKVQNQDNSLITVKQACIRYVSATVTLPINLIFCIFSQRNLSISDYLSNSIVIYYG